MKNLVSVRRYLLRPPHWSSLVAASCFGVMAGIADYSLLSILVSALICFWLLHSAGKFGSCLPIGFLANDYYGPLQWLKPGPYHLMGMNEWLLVLHAAFLFVWLTIGFLVGPMGLGKLSEHLSRRSNNEVSPRFYLALMVVPFGLLWFLPIGISMY